MRPAQDRKSTRLNSSHQIISYAVFCLKKKKKLHTEISALEQAHCITLHIQHGLKPRADSWLAHCRWLMQDLGVLFSFFFFNDTATTEIYTLSLHDALPIWGQTKIGQANPIRLHFLSDPAD